MCARASADTGASGNLFSISLLKLFSVVNLQVIPAACVYIKVINKLFKKV